LKTKTNSRTSDLKKAGPILVSLSRLQRAKNQLRVEPLPDHPLHFHVEGGAEPHWVSLHPYFDCDCADFIFRDVICAHLAASLSYIGRELRAEPRTIYANRRPK